MGTAESARQSIPDNQEEKRRLDLEIEQVYAKLEGKDLRRAIAEIIVQIRRQKPCQHSVT